MKVILLDNVKGVGKKDEVINASDGYARNFLFPKNLAVEANAENMNKLNNKKSSEQHKKDVEKDKAQQIANKMKDITLTIKVKAGDNGKIFGGVTAKEIAVHFRKVLPAFMVPRKTVNLDAVPHLPNGKVDMQTLKTYFK